MFLISNKVKCNEENSKLSVGNVVPEREAIKERKKKDLHVDTYFCDAKNSMDTYFVKASVASLVLAIVIQDNSIILPSWENYRGVFCHHSFCMNRLSHYSYFKWTDWINSTTILQTSFFDSYDDIVLKGKVITIYPDSSFDLLIKKTKQILRIPEKLIYQRVKSPRDVSACPLFLNGKCEYGTELDLTFDLIGVWDIIFYNVCYYNISNYNKRPIPFAPRLPNVNTLVDIEKRNYNITQALDTICNKWIYKGSRDHLLYWEEEAFDSYLFDCKAFKPKLFSKTVDDYSKASLAYNFVHRVFLFISGLFEFLVPASYIDKALYYENNPLEAMEFCLNSSRCSRHTLLWFLPHCYQVFAKNARKYPSMMNEIPKVKKIFRNFCKKRSMLDESYYFYVLRGDVNDANKCF